MTVNGVGNATDCKRSDSIGGNMQMDSISRNLKNQIANAQKKLQELSSNQELSLEEKMKKRQEIQQEISSLTQQLRQHQIELRKQQQNKSSNSVDELTGADYDDTENSDSADNNKEFRYIKMAFNYVSEIDTIKNVCTFEYTDRQQAIDGLRNNYYVMAIIVPENMISDIMSGENTPVEVVCQSEGVNNTSMIFREMVRAGGSDLATAEAGIYTFDDLFNGVLKNYRGLRGTHENKLNDIYLSYALNRSIYFKTRDISVKEGLSTVQFYVCTAIVMLLLLSTITCAGQYEGAYHCCVRNGCHVCVRCARNAWLQQAYGAYFPEGSK